MAQAVSVAFETVTIEHGVWCDACALSSAHRVWFTVTVGGRARLDSRTVCEEHGTPVAPSS